MGAQLRQLISWFQCFLERLYPLAVFRVVNSEAGTEFPIGESDLPFHRLVGEEPRPAGARFQISSLIRAEFAHVNRSAMFDGPPNDVYNQPRHFTKQEGNARESKTSLSVRYSIIRLRGFVACDRACG
jgi:hypothetical protein